MGEEKNTGKTTPEEYEEYVKKGKTTAIQEISVSLKELAKDMHTFLLLGFALAFWLVGSSWNKPEANIEIFKDYVIPVLLGAVAFVINYRYSKAVSNEMLRAYIEKREPSKGEALKKAVTRYRL